MVKYYFMAFIRTVKGIPKLKKTKSIESFGTRLMILVESYVYVGRIIED